MEMEDPSLNLQQQPVRAPTPPPEENHQVLEQVEVEKPPVEEPVDNSKPTQEQEICMDIKWSA